MFRIKAHDLSITSFLVPSHFGSIVRRETFECASGLGCLSSWNGGSTSFRESTSEYEYEKQISPSNEMLYGRLVGLSLKAIYKPSLA